MLLPILLGLFVITTANPFHKYPYVFLLDIGNEELEKANTEQIRLTVPGGSIALRYPAIGDGETIAHVRVSGIDFGTDLKANIIDGGPGYKYVVLVFMGNPGVTYDAVLTLQTVPVESEQSINPPNVSYKVINAQDGDPNDSSEDFGDDPSSGSSQDPAQKNAEFTQSSSNVYRYAQNEDVISVNNHEYEEKDNMEDNNGLSGSNCEENNDDDDDDNDGEDEDKDEIDDDDTNNDHNDESNDAKPQQFSDSDDDDYENEGPLRDPDEANDNYKLEEDTRVNEVDEENPEIRRLFRGNYRNDEDKYKDWNNNDYIDSEDSFAVAY